MFVLHVLAVLSHGGQKGALNCSELSYIVVNCNVVAEN